jgi:hydroxylamine reductase (hybrid-cluster protein)
LTSEEYALASLPAFATPGVLDVLVENFGVKPITTASDDLRDSFLKE